MKTRAKTPAPSYFDPASLNILRDALGILEQGFTALPGVPSPDDRRLAGVLEDVARRMTDNFPYFHPLYAGQMLKPPHPIARLAYMLSLWVNPNNHALDGGRASSALEKEAVAELARMIGYQQHLGHLTGGGTVANLEALWISGRLHPGKAVAASDQAHYTHSRISGVLGFPFRAIRSDRRGRMNLQALREAIKDGDIGTVVATMGTTATGAVDPLPEILDVCRGAGIRVHADAAYGGYFRLSSTLTEEVRTSMGSLGEADSVVIDPHKHGLQPYGCGCVLFRDPSVGRFYRHDSPYTYFTSDEMHLGEISLECSRPGASATALWATQRLLPLEPGGEFARQLDRGRSAALRLHGLLASDRRWITGPVPDLDIVVWAPSADSISAASLRSRRVFTEAARHGLHLALAELPASLFTFPEGMHTDAERVTCLRSVLMKPEHADWVDRIHGILNDSINSVTST